MSTENEIMLDALIEVLDELIAEATAQRAKLLSARERAAQDPPAGQDEPNPA